MSRDYGDIEESIPLVQDSNIIHFSSQKNRNRMAIYLAIASLVIVLTIINTGSSPLTTTLNSKMSILQAESTSDFDIGTPKLTSVVADGNIEVLSGNDMKIDCSSNALIGFNLQNVKEGVNYQYYCDDSGSPLMVKQDVETDWYDTTNGDDVSSLSHFKVDCGIVGINYVLTRTELVEDNGKLQYRFQCATYDLAMLTCAQFYTDLADPQVTGGSVSSLAKHAVQCFVGSALQMYQYQVVDDKVRYSYHCCTKDIVPTPSPTPIPTALPSMVPTLEPTYSPTLNPIADPSASPVSEPTVYPTFAPSLEPTQAPAAIPTELPTQNPIASPTFEPIAQPTLEPNAVPTLLPTLEPTAHPTLLPTQEPISNPTYHPTKAPRAEPTLEPIAEPTERPSRAPRAEPTLEPIAEPTVEPSRSPRATPTFEPTASPTVEPTLEPRAQPTLEPISAPTLEPSPEPIAYPTLAPSDEPVALPTKEPIALPTYEPTKEPTLQPSFQPVSEPTIQPSLEPISEPTRQPRSEPTYYPTDAPIADPTLKPSESPVADPTKNPVLAPTLTPTTFAVDPIVVASYNYPMFCPFTYLQGTSKIEWNAGCVLLSTDVIDYMRDEETSPSLYVCAGVENGDVKLTRHDLMKYGLITPDGYGQISQVFPGKGTSFSLYASGSDSPVYSADEDHHEILSVKHVSEHIITAGILQSAISVTDVLPPKDCGLSVANAAAAEDGNKPHTSRQRH